MNEENFQEIKHKVEAVLFSYGDWITIPEIMEALSVDSEILIKNALEELLKKFEINHSFLVEEEDGKWRMALKDEYDEVVTALISGTEIPRNVLKVLSVIAYEQPVTKTRLGEILGRYVKQEVDYLHKAKFLTYEKHGIGKYFRVTKKFYDYFKIEEDDEFRNKANENIKTYLKSNDQIVEDLGLKMADFDEEISENEGENLNVEIHKHNSIEEVAEELTQQQKKSS